MPVSFVYRGAAEEGQRHVSSAVHGKRCLTGISMHAAARRPGHVSLLSCSCLHACICWVCPYRICPIGGITHPAIAGPRMASVRFRPYLFFSQSVSRSALLVVSIVIFSIYKYAVYFSLG